MPQPPNDRLPSGGLSANEPRIYAIAGGERFPRPALETFFAQDRSSVNAGARPGCGCDPVAKVYCSCNKVHRCECVAHTTCPCVAHPACGCVGHTACPCVAHSACGCVGHTCGCVGHYSGGGGVIVGCRCAPVH
jgi:hypothetical protein